MFYRIVEDLTNILGPKNIAKNFLSYIDPFDNCAMTYFDKKFSKILLVAMVPDCKQNEIGTCLNNYSRSMSR